MGELLARGHVRRHARNDMTVAKLPYSKEPRSLTLFFDSFVPSALWVMDREKNLFFLSRVLFATYQNRSQRKYNLSALSEFINYWPAKNRVLSLKLGFSLTYEATCCSAAFSWFDLRTIRVSIRNVQLVLSLVKLKDCTVENAFTPEKLFVV